MKGYSELLTFKGKTDGTSTTGDFTLNSDLLYSTLTNIRLPKGSKAKIWCKRIAGAAVEVIINFTKDVTASTPTWNEVDRQNLASTGELSLEKQRPIVVRSATGKEAVKISWSQSPAAVSHIAVEVELTDE